LLQARFVEFLAAFKLTQSLGKTGRHKFGSFVGPLLITLHHESHAAYMTCPLRPAVALACTPRRSLGSIALYNAINRSVRSASDRSASNSIRKERSVGEAHARRKATGSSRSTARCAFSPPISSSSSKCSAVHSSRIARVAG